MRLISLEITVKQTRFDPLYAILLTYGNNIWKRGEFDEFYKSFPLSE